MNFVRSRPSYGRTAATSARYIFGSALGDLVADEIHRALRVAGKRGLTRTEIRDLFKRNQPAERVGVALEEGSPSKKATQERRDDRRKGGSPYEPVQNARDELRHKRFKRPKSDLCRFCRSGTGRVMGALLDLAKMVFAASDAAAINPTVGWRWRVTPADAPSFDVFYSPHARLDEVERQYPGAKVDPVPAHRPSRTATASESAELRQLVTVVYAEDSEADRAEALAMALVDAEAALTCYRDIAARSMR